MKYFSWKHLVCLGAFVLLVVHPSRAFACDPLGCLLIGKDQDMLALVTVTQVEVDATAVVIPEHVYEHPFFQFAKRSFTIQFQKGTPWITLDPKEGAHYFVSLKCAKDVCVPAWGAWEVDGANFETAKLVNVRSGDDAAIQWYMNGKGSDFYGVGEKMFARTVTGDVEIYPEPGSVKSLVLHYWIAGFLILICAGLGIYLILRACDKK